MNNEAREIREILDANPQIGVLNGTSVNGKYYIWKNHKTIWAEHPSELVGLLSEA